MNKKVIIWTSGIDDLLSGKGSVGGLTVQMMFWAFSFNESNWKVFSFTKYNSRIFMQLNLLRFPQYKYFNVLFESIYSIYILLKIRPTLIIFRGASRTLFIISWLSSLFNIKLVFFGASDVNFIKGKEGISGRDYNKKLFRKGLYKTSKIIVQNSEQARLLNENYGKNAITIPNIWPAKSELSEGAGNIIWVGNFRSLKRPEWFIRLAASFPQEQFIMAGYPDPSNLNLFNKCKQLSDSLLNVTFLGGISFAKSEELFGSAKILICTSEYEGFPNTFLQAWSRNIPIISTVNPNMCITDKELGIIVKNEFELKRSLTYILSNEEYVNKVKLNILNYFKKCHSPNIHYSTLIDFIYN